MLSQVTRTGLRLRAAGTLQSKMQRIARMSAGDVNYIKDESFKASKDTPKSVELHELSVKDPSKFWGQAAKDIDWFKPYDKVVDTSRSPFNRWFPGGELNTSYNCLDRHVNKGFGNRTAIIFDSPVTNTIRKVSYKELLDQVCTAAGMLRELGVGKGDRVVVYMPNVPEAAVSMLACARLGAVHSVVFGGFAAPELATRIRDCRPKVILASSCGIDGAKVIDYKTLLDSAIDLASDVHKVPSCVILQREQKRAPLVAGRDVEWSTAMAAVKAPVREAVPVASTDPLYILYTSGTTGAPKGVLRDNGGHAVALKWTMDNLYAAKPGSVFWSASDVGWVVGHSYMIYGPLLQGAATLMYEGKPIGTPDASNFWRTIERHNVNVLFTAPTAIRAIRRQDADGELPAKFNTSSLQTLFLAGEHADPHTIHWAEDALKVPVRDHWWQTETGWAICSNLLGVDGVAPIKHGSCFRPCPGYDLQALDSNHQPVPVGELGSLAIKLPLPPGTMLTLYNNDERYVSAYMTSIPGYYDTGDAGVIDEDGYVHVMSRTDDVINVAGHRLSTGAMEEVLLDHHDIAEVAVAGIRDGLKGQVPIALIVINDACKRPTEDIEKEAVAMIRERIGALACLRKVVPVKGLPKTRSGKILRGTIRQIGNGEKYAIPATCESPEVLGEIEKLIRDHEELKS